MQLLKGRYRPDELAEILRVSKRTVDDYLRNGIFIPEDGRPLRISREEIARVLKLETPTQEFKLLKAQEAAKQIGGCANSVYYYYNKKQLRGIRFGGTIRFFESDVKKFLQSRG